MLQVRELGIPCMLLLNCIHTTGPSRSELRAEARRLESALDLPVRVIDASKDKAGDWVRSWAPILSMQKACAGIRSVPASMVHGVELLRPHLRTGTPGFLCHLLRMREVPAWLSPEAQEAWRQATTTMDSPAAMQLEEAGERMGQIKELLPNLLTRSTLDSSIVGQPSDAPRLGPVGVWSDLLLMFQAVYSWATVPTDLLDGWMAAGMDAVKRALPETWWRSLIVDGMLSGLAGIFIFLPQIMILFGFTAVLEHSGAMARLGTWATASSGNSGSAAAAQ